METLLLSSEDAATIEEVTPVFERLAQSVGSRLKKAEKKAGMVSMEIKYYDFRTVSHQIQLDKPSNDPEVLKETCLQPVSRSMEWRTGSVAGHTDVKTLG